MTYYSTQTAGNTILQVFLTSGQKESWNEKNSHMHYPHSARGSDGVNTLLWDSWPKATCWHRTLGIARLHMVILGEDKVMSVSQVKAPVSTLFSTLLIHPVIQYQSLHHNQLFLEAPLDQCSGLCYLYSHFYTGRQFYTCHKKWTSMHGRDQSW